jgi:hypothetical protein
VKVRYLLNIPYTLYKVYLTENVYLNLRRRFHQLDDYFGSGFYITAIDHRANAYVAQNVVNKNCSTTVFENDMLLLRPSLSKSV